MLPSCVVQTCLSRRWAGRRAALPALVSGRRLTFVHFCPGVCGSRTLGPRSTGAASRHQCAPPFSCPPDRHNAAARTPQQLFWCDVSVFVHLTPRVNVLWAPCVRYVCASRKHRVRGVHAWSGWRYEWACSRRPSRAAACAGSERALLTFPPCVEGDFCMATLPLGFHVFLPWPGAACRQQESRAFLFCLVCLSAG